MGVAGARAPVGGALASGGQRASGARTRAMPSVQGRGTRRRRGQLRGQRLDLVNGVALPAIVDLEHSVGQLGLELGGELRWVGTSACCHAKTRRGEAVKERRATYLAHSACRGGGHTYCTWVPRMARRADGRHVGSAPRVFDNAVGHPLARHARLGDLLLGGRQFRQLQELGLLARRVPVPKGGAAAAVAFRRGEDAIRVLRCGRVLRLVVAEVVRSRARGGRLRCFLALARARGLARFLRQRTRVFAEALGARHLGTVAVEQRHGGGWMAANSGDGWSRSRYVVLSRPVAVASTCWGSVGRAPKRGWARARTRRSQVPDPVELGTRKWHGRQKWDLLGSGSPIASRVEGGGSSRLVSFYPAWKLGRRRITGRLQARFRVLPNAGFPGGAFAGEEKSGRSSAANPTQHASANGHGLKFVRCGSGRSSSALAPRAGREWLYPMQVPMDPDVHWHGCP